MDYCVLTVEFFQAFKNDGHKILMSLFQLLRLPLRKHLSIRTGAKYISGDGDDHAIDKLVIHPGYNTTSNDNDISLIKVHL